MAIAQVGSFGTLATAAGASVSPTFGQSTTAGSLLIAVVSADVGNITTSASGWFAFSTNRDPTIWYKPNCGAGETAPTFTAASGTFMDAVLSEWSGAHLTSPQDQIGLGTSLTTSPAVLAADAADATASNLAIFALRVTGSKTQTLTFAQTWTPSGGSAGIIGDDHTVKQLEHMFAGYYLLNGNGGGSADQDSVVITPSTGTITYRANIVTFLPPAAAVPNPKPLPRYGQAVMRGATR